MDKWYTALCLALLLVGSEANAINNHPLLLLKQHQPERWDGLGTTAVVNDYVDEVIKMIIPLMEPHGMEPLPLPEVIEGFEVRPLLITYSAWLKIHDGYMTGLSSVKRNGDQRVSYFAQMMRFHIELVFEDMEFNYNYLVQAMNLGPTGRIIGTLDRCTAVVDLIVDFNNDEAHLQHFSLDDIGRLRVRLAGNILTDWLVNPVIGVFIRIFDTIIIRSVESDIRSGIQDLIDAINSGVKEILYRLENI